jgi:hypothetical protein
MRLPCHLLQLEPLLACCRSYIQRRTKEEFHTLAANADAAAADAAWQRAKSQLEVWKRQSVVYQLYGRKIKTVLVSSCYFSLCRTLQVSCTHRAALAQVQRACLVDQHSK